MPASAQPSHEAGQTPASVPSFLILGRIARPHGVRGEINVQIVTAYPERISDLEQVYIGRDPYDASGATAFTLSGVRRHRGAVLIRLEGITTREDAERYRDQFLMVALDNAVPLEEGEYYLFEIIGAVVVTDQGETLGRVSDVLETGANDVFVVTGGTRGEVLIPDIPEVVQDIDLEQKRITITPLPGLLPD